MLEGRLPNHGEPVEALQSRGILLTSVPLTRDDKRLLLQDLLGNPDGAGVL